MRKSNFILCVILIVVQNETSAGQAAGQENVPRTAAEGDAEKPAAYEDVVAAALARDDEPKRPSGPGAARVGGGGAAENDQRRVLSCGELGQLLGDFVRERLAGNAVEPGRMSVLSGRLASVVSNAMGSCAAGRLGDVGDVMRTLSDVMQDAALTGEEAEHYGQDELVPPPPAALKTRERTVV